MKYLSSNNDPIICTNCGGAGHISKRCNFPLISYGVICYRYNNNRLEYIMVQRKDSLCYVEFIRGKYDFTNISYITMLMSNMTDTERRNILTFEFDYLWKTLWQTDDNTGFMREYNEACNKFNMLKHGIYIRNNNVLSICNLLNLIENTNSLLTEQEWGFPKGRRNINESDIDCALREFEEETGINKKHIRIKRLKPVEEIFSGSNNVRYKHIYYITNIDTQITKRYHYNPYNKQQITEIKDMKWFTCEEVLSHINNTNIERKEMFKRVDKLLQNL
jgi:8-oxo-dGTP pyrophosphatase MutT (NUDIX family)